MTLQLIQAGPNRAYAVVEPDAEGYTAHITANDYRNVPQDMESDEMCFEIYSEGGKESIFSFKAKGRKSLRDWYVKNVGHDPDENGPVPIHELVADVAMHLLLRIAK